MRLRKVSIPFAAIVLAMLPAVLDQTILATALPTIASDLGTLADVSWLVAAYVVASAATIPVWGKLGDRVGRKTVLEFSLGLFLAASAVCGLAGDLTTLIFARAVQGAAAGGLMTLAMAVRRRPRLAHGSAPATRATSRRPLRSPPSPGPFSAAC